MIIKVYSYANSVMQIKKMPSEFTLFFCALVSSAQRWLLDDTWKRAQSPTWPWCVIWWDGSGRKSWSWDVKWRSCRWVTTAFSSGNWPTTHASCRRLNCATTMSSSARPSTRTATATSSRCPPFWMATAAAKAHICPSTSACCPASTTACWSGPSPTRSPSPFWTRATRRCPNLSISRRPSTLIPTGRTSKNRAAAETRWTRARWASVTPSSSRTRRSRRGTTSVTTPSSSKLP